MNDLMRAEAALRFISSVDRETWVMCGMALRSEFGDAARDLWMDWSREADSFRESDARAVWRSFKGTGISFASLIHEAKQYGFKDDKAYQPPTREQIAAQQRAAAERLTKEGQERIKAAQDAAKKAAWIMHQTKNERHAYLDSKGWPEAVGAVWWPTEDNNLLCIPMRIGDHLVGLQMIDRTGAKKFLKGQRTSEAEYVISNPGRGCAEWYCEGLATGLSLRDCLHALRMRYRIHITFSAQNMVKVAAKHGDGYVVADNDKSGTGERVAKQIGMPYWISGLAGEDFNDFHKRVRLFGASQELRKFLSNSTRRA